MRALTPIFFLALFFLVSTTIQAQKIKGSGEVITQTKKVEGFKGLRVRSNIDVELKQGAYALEIEAEDNVIEYIKIKLIQDKLILEVDDDVKIKSEIRPKIYLQAPDLNFVEITDEGALSTKSVIKVPELRIEANGSSDSNFILDVKKLNVTMDDSGRLRMSGYAVKQKIKMEGATKYDAKLLNTEESDVLLGGSAVADVIAYTKVFGDLSEAAKCFYYGQPTKGADIITTDGASYEHIAK